MYDIRRRLKKIEKIMGLDKKHITLNIVWFGGESPPDQTDGNITIHYVMYEDIVKK